MGADQIHEVDSEEGMTPESQRDKFNHQSDEKSSSLMQYTRTNDEQEGDNTNMSKDLTSPFDNNGSRQGLTLTRDHQLIDLTVNQTKFSSKSPSLLRPTSEEDYLMRTKMMHQTASSASILEELGDDFEISHSQIQALERQPPNAGHQ